MKPKMRRKGTQTAFKAGILLHTQLAIHYNNGMKEEERSCFHSGVPCNSAMSHSPCARSPCHTAHTPVPARGCASITWHSQPLPPSGCPSHTCRDTARAVPTSPGCWASPGRQRGSLCTPACCWVCTHTAPGESCHLTLKHST